MSEDNIEIIRRAYEAANRGDFANTNAYVHPGIEFHTYAQSPEAGVYRGKEAVLKYNENLFEQFESTRFDVEEIIDAGDRVVVLSTQHAVPKGGHQEISVRVIEVWTIRDGRLPSVVPTRPEKKPLKLRVCQTDERPILSGSGERFRIARVAAARRYRIHEKGTFWAPTAKSAASMASQHSEASPPPPRRVATVGA